MSDECKLCALLGSTGLIDSLDGHSELHSRQLQLIEQNQTDGTVNKTQPVPLSGQIPKQRTKKSALFKFSRELINIHGRKDCGIKCSQCQHSIKSKRGTKSTMFSLINHACVHLNKDLFACRHCHLKFVTKGGVYRHLRIIHSLSNVRANREYIDLTDDHQNDIKDLLELCFGKAPAKQLNVTAFGKQKRNNQGSQDPLLKLSYGCIEKHQPGNRFKCNLCPTSIANNNHQNAAKRLLDHARWHVEKPIFTCSLCQYSASTLATVNSHLHNSHKVAQSNQNSKDESNKYFEEISSMLKDCFGDMKKEGASVISKEEKRALLTKNRIRNRCGTNLLRAERQLRCSDLAKRFQRSGKLECRICHVQLAVVTATQTNYTQGPMQHALAHFNKILFSCRRCSYSSLTKNAMGDHVRSKHGVPTTNEIDDRTDDFHADFMDMLSKCYDWDLEPERSEAAITIPKNNLAISSKMRGNDLKAARHIRALELIKTYSKDGKIICRICTHPLSVSGVVRSQHVFNHALTHLDKRFWPYRCKLCSHISIVRTNILRHQKTTHNDKGEFEDMSNKFHSEIMNILSRCYEGVETGETS